MSHSLLDYFSIYLLGVSCLTVSSIILLRAHIKGTITHMSSSLLSIATAVAKSFPMYFIHLLQEYCIIFPFAMLSVKSCGFF